VKKLSCTVAVARWLLLLSPLSGLAQGGAEFGIDRSNLTRESETMQEKTLKDSSTHRISLGIECVTKWDERLMAGRTAQLSVTSNRISFSLLYITPWECRSRLECCIPHLGSCRAR